MGNTKWMQVSSTTKGCVSVSFREEKESGDVSTVIDNYRLAETFFTAKYLFVSNKMKEQAADLDPIDCKTYLARLSDA